MTLVNMCNSCPHNPFKHKVAGGTEVVPDWMQYISETFWNKPELAEPPQWLLDGLKKNTELTPEDQCALAAMPLLVSRRTGKGEPIDTSGTFEEFHDRMVVKRKELKEKQDKTIMDGEPVPLKEYMRAQIGYQNKDMLYLIGELPAEHRPTFKKMFDTMIDRMIEMQVKSLPLS